MARIAVLMSGGVDSSCAALILKSRGHEVLGITARMLNGASKCCGEEDIYRAQRVCHKLGMPHVVLDLAHEFREHVLNTFIASYLEGMTPNPCAACNRHIKFGSLIEKAARLGCERVASGHYAAVCENGGRRLLREPLDRRKSQIYFLSLVRPEVLDRVEFPLEGLEKVQVTEMVVKAGLPAREGESQDLCFVPGGKYHGLLKPYSEGIGPGNVLDTHGMIVGRHRGHYAYTVGKRFGIRGKRRYVIAKRARANEIVVGERSEASTRTIVARNLNFFTDPETLRGETIQMKYRYNSPAVDARITHIDGDCMGLVTDHDCFAPAPGQIVACYRGDRLVCGGIIGISR